MMAILYLVAYVELPISFPHPWRRSWPSPLPMALPSLGCASKVEISNSPNFFLIADCANLRTFGLARSKTKGWNQVVRPLAWMKSHRGKAEEGPTLSTISWGNHVSRCQHELEPGSSAENAHIGQQCFQWKHVVKQPNRQRITLSTLSSSHSTPVPASGWLATVWSGCSCAHYGSTFHGGDADHLVPHLGSRCSEVITLHLYLRAYASFPACCFKSFSEFPPLSNVVKEFAQSNGLDTLGVT